MVNLRRCSAVQQLDVVLCEMETVIYLIRWMAISYAIIDANKHNGRTDAIINK